MSGLIWLVVSGIVYLIAAIANLIFKFCAPELLSFAYCVILSLPLWIPPLARWCNMLTIWEIK